MRSTQTGALHPWYVTDLPLALTRFMSPFQVIDFDQDCSWVGGDDEGPTVAADVDMGPAADVVCEEDGEAVSFLFFSPVSELFLVQETIELISQFLEASHVPFHPLSLVSCTTNVDGNIVPLLPSCKVELPRLTDSLLREFGACPGPRTRVKVHRSSFF